jgi:Pyruvate/2-oxoacid:ferredoxin oxidoreductase delta subunit
VELRILRRLFTPEDAELAMHLSLIAEEPRVIARRAKIPVEEATRRLAEMEKKGLVYATHREGRAPRYLATPIVIGFYEFQVNKLVPELVEDIEEYGSTWFDLDVWKKAPLLRTIPVGESIDPHLEVMAYERAEELVRGQDRFAVAPCICRQERELAGHRCDKPMETCLIFGDSAAYYVRNEMGRYISQEEALQILALAEEAGLVLQPGNAKKAGNICTCCGCCCRILKSIKDHPKPASIVSSAFVAALDVNTCEGCGTCELRCQMEAVYVDNGHATLDLDRCIGCGLCVPTCPSESLSLVRKSATVQPTVPKDVVDTNIKLAQARGKLGTGQQIGLLVQSRVDRLLAPR